MGTLDLYAVSTGSGQSSSTQIWTIGNATSGSAMFTSGSSDARLYEGADGNLYIYGQAGILLRSTDGGASFSSIFPTTIGTSSKIAAISQTEYTPSSGSAQKFTVVFTSGSAGDSAGKYQSSPETAAGWKDVAIKPTGSLNVTDMIFDETLTADLIVGNDPADLNTFTGFVFRYSPPAEAFSAFTTSDGGIRPYNPELLPSIIDLDMPG